MLDAISTRLIGRGPRERALLRRCAIASRRIEAYRDEEGRRHANFLMSIAETYGADGGERLPLFTVLSWLLYYSHRIGDDINWGHNISGPKFDLDGGMYEEFWRDFKFVAGNSGATFLRGPFFSNMVKSGRMQRGHYSFDGFEEEELRRRLCLGGAIPSVRTLNGRPKPEDTITRGGMSEPLGRVVDELAKSYKDGMARLTGERAEDLEPDAIDSLLKRKLADCGFDADGMESVVIGPGDVKCVYKRGAKEPRAWWEGPEPVPEPVIDAIMVEAVPVGA
jgi:hypothetical protein